MIRPPTRSTRTDTLFTVTTLFRSLNERLVDEFVALGGGNFYRDLALPSAEQTIFNLFGIKDVDPAFLRGLVDAFLFVHDYDATPEQLRRADDAALAMREFWEVEYRKRVEQPGDDMQIGRAHV